jgi:catechol 2,3-dioxygenase-like lactoylglutathione lyase family enzyme
MPITNGIHHVALISADLDRWLDFYVGVFAADVRVDMTEDGLRHVMLDVGGGATLHAFMLPGNRWAEATDPMFERGHVDHVALEAPTRDAFEHLRRRLVDRGASDGTVTDFGSVRSVSFVDPDGWEGEVALWQAGQTLPFAQRRRELLASAQGRS